MLLALLRKRGRWATDNSNIKISSLWIAVKRGTTGSMYFLLVAQIEVQSNKVIS